MCLKDCLIDCKRYIMNFNCGLSLYCSKWYSFCFWAVTVHIPVTHLIPTVYVTGTYRGEESNGRDDWDIHTGTWCQVDGVHLQSVVWCCFFRDDAQAKKFALKEKTEKEIVQYNMELKACLFVCVKLYSNRVSIDYTIGMSMCVCVYVSVCVCVHVCACV